mmetsp:Transcript_87573/g.245129  ORF Transcript_87573/g.245129 Transcript_87573/m.245129 type:complete len:289 (-) Transcript_87573:30-896(-)
MMMKTPVTHTSSIDNFLRNIATSSNTGGRLRVTCMKTAAISRTSMSRTVKAITSTLRRKKATAEFTSQCSRLSSASGRIHSKSCFVQFHKVTSSAASSWMCIASTSGFREMSTFPDWKSKSMSNLNAMHGLVMPKTSMTTKTMQTTTVHTSAGNGLKPKPVFGSPSSMPTSPFVGARTPSEEIVEATQNVAKQVKPMSRSIKPIKIGGLLRPRMRYVRSMYANISGEAHFEIRCTNITDFRAQLLFPELLLCRRMPPTTSKINLAIGSTMAKPTTNTQPSSEPEISNS